MPELSLPENHARTFTLPNGLELIVEEDHSAAVVSVQAWVKTGSIHEGKWLGAGLSHLLEHMLFKGTATRGSQDFARAVQDHGGYINAYTSFDRTVYWIDTPTRGAADAIDLLSDALMNSTLPADELVKEQEVIRREFAMGFDDPDSVAGKQLFATAFSQHPLRHPVIGHLDVFNQIGREDLVSYYQARYAPNNIFFVVVGDVDPEAVHAQLAAIFAKHPRRPLPDILLPREPAQLGRREQHTEFPTELTRIGFAWHVPEITHPDLPALDLLATVLGGGRSARLYRRLREELGIVHNIDAWCYTPASAGMFGIDAVLDPERRETVQAEVFAQLAAIANDGVAAGELDKARRQFLSHQLGALTTMRGKASDLGSNWLYARSLRFTHDYLEAAQQVTPEDLRRVARLYFKAPNLTLSSVNPSGTLAKGAANDATTRANETKLFTLSNGLRLLVREDHRIPLASVVATFQAGLLAETPETNGLSRLFSRTMLKGTATRTAEQIADTIEAVGGSLGSDSGNNSVSVSVRVLQPDLELAMGLLADVLRHATFPEKAVAREKNVQLASIKADEEEMTSVARNLLRNRLFGAHPFALRSLGTPESVRSLCPSDLIAFRDRIVCGRNGVIAVFGAVDATQVLKLAEAAFGELPEGAPAFAALPQPVALGDSAEVEAMRPKAQAVLMVGFPGVDFFSPDRVPLELIDEACSDLGSRLFNRIREEMGLAYFVGSQNLMGLTPGAFSFYLGTDPAKLAEVRAALADEIRKLAEGGLTAQELSRAKEKLLGAQEIRNQSNDALAFSCALDELYGLGHSHHETLRARVEAVTLEQVREVASRYFTHARVTAIARPMLDGLA
jgi:zinc protease